MAILSAMISSLSAYYPGSDNGHRDLNIIRLLSKAKTIAAFSYKKSIGQPFIYPRNELTYTQNFLQMMFAVPAEDYVVSPALDRALNLLLILHADHEQNCSTSTVRMVGSSGANLFASISSGICALWGPLHGGANQQVIEMLQQIRESGDDPRKWVEKAKNKDSGFKSDGLRTSRLQELRSSSYDPAESRGRGADRAGRPGSSPVNCPRSGADCPDRLVLHRAQAVSECGFLQRHHLSRHGNPHQCSQVMLRGPVAGMDRSLEGNGGGSGQPHQSAAPDLHRGDQRSFETSNKPK